MKLKKIIIGTVGILSALIVVSILYLNHFFSDVCANEVFDEIVSPEGNFKAVTFQRDCGATTGFNTQISIIKNDEMLTNAPGNIYIIDGHPGNSAPKMKWINDKKLHIEVDLDGNEYKAKKKWGRINAVEIQYGENGSSR